MQEKQRVGVQSTELRISLGKSKRLAAMRQSVEMRVDKEVSQQKPATNKKDRETQLARLAISKRITEIKATYSPGMQNKLFALRYGSEEKIEQMSLKQLFVLLNIKQVLAKEIANLKFQEKQS